MFARSPYYGDRARIVPLEKLPIHIIESLYL